MAALIQNVARQAQQTFSKNLPEEHFAECLSVLRRLVHQLRPRDLNFNIDHIQPHHHWFSGRSAPVAYMDISETSVFTMGVFVIRPGCHIPLHDHPGMHGLLKVIHGRLRIKSYTPKNITSVSGCAEVTNCEMSEDVCDCCPEDEPKLLSPNTNNLHEVSAGGDTGAAFLDILAPPYQPSAGRDCRYYNLQKCDGQKDGNRDLFRVIEIPPPEEFWCEPISYRGPKIVI